MQDPHQSTVALHSTEHPPPPPPKGIWTCGKPPLPLLPPPHEKGGAFPPWGGGGAVGGHSETSRLSLPLSCLRYWSSWDSRASGLAPTMGTRAKGLLPLEFGLVWYGLAWSGLV